jgi:hypothetical protein
MVIMLGLECRKRDSQKNVALNTFPQKRKHSQNTCVHQPQQFQVFMTFRPDIHEKVEWLIVVA